MLRTPLLPLASFVLALVAAAARPVDGDAAVEDAILAASAIADRANHPAADALETEAIYVSDGAAVRRSHRLTLRLESGATKIYANSLPRCAPGDQQPTCIAYTLAGYLPSRKLFVVARLQTDTTSYVVVDAASGTATALPSLPLVSPSGNRLMVVATDEANGKRLVIFKRSRGRFAAEWTGPLDGGKPRSTFEVIGWRSNDAIRVRQTTWGRNGEPETIAELRRSGRDWKLAKAGASPTASPLRWNWRRVWGSHHPTVLAPPGEPYGPADVVFGRRMLKIALDGGRWSFTGRIDDAGDIVGVATAFEGDAGPGMMVGRYEEAQQHPLGRRPECILREIVLRDALTDRRPYPNGSLVTVVKQLPEDCDRMSESE